MGRCQMRDELPLLIELENLEDSQNEERAHVIAKLSVGAALGILARLRDKYCISKRDFEDFTMLAGHVAITGFVAGLEKRDKEKTNESTISTKT